MTEPVLGSSLLQARDVHSSHHNHLRSHHNHERFHKRQDESSETVVQVVQTVSIIQLIDASGATVGTTTQTSEPSTTQYYAVEATFGIESEPDATTSITDDVSDTTVSSVSPETASSIGTEVSTDTAASTTTSMPSSFPTVESFAQITATPSDSSTSFPTFAGVTNSTTTAAPTTSLFSNETFSIQAVDHSNLTTSTLPYSSGTVLYNDTFTTTISASSSFTSSFASFTGIATSTGSEDGGSVTGTAFGGGSGSDSTATGASSSASSTSTSDSGSGSSSSTTPAGTVAGSVLGAVAGVGLILIAALMLLRYKKRQRGLRLSDGNSLPGTRGLVLGGGGSGGGPSDGTRGNAMGEVSEQRRSIPFAVPAALANLTGYKRFSQRTTTSSEGTEKGFQKVSGRKLPSVLQHGGDGYSDPTNPRDTISTEQSFYRDSTGFFGGPNMPRLAVGSPMRPESGIPVFHPGPARVAVTESGYFGSNLEPPPSRDALGRSLPSRDGSNYSRGSGSRFTEEI